MWLRIENGELIQINRYDGIGPLEQADEWSVVAYAGLEREKPSIHLADGFETRDMAVRYIDALQRTIATGSHIAIHAQLLAMQESM